MLPKLKKVLETQNLVMFLFVVIAFSMAWNTAQVIQKNYELQKQITRLQQEIEILELENANLAYDNEYYETDTYLELAAREKFNKARPGEKVLLLPKDISPDFEADDSAERVAPERSNFQRWLDFLSGKGVQI